ncbi:hypothetical protein [Paenibacillus kribbensis]|uniref:hypothetical protein n=1 Tax=Paenibacillus kribbensis TaxID=172713 RepID=UPI000AD3A283|nr:hypothetical protein [Paenibacillus kribbensis]
MDTEGTVSKGDQLSITHHPHVVLASDASKEDVVTTQALILQAEKDGHIGQLLIKAGVLIGTEGKVSIGSGEDTTSTYIEKHGLEW